MTTMQTAIALRDDQFTFDDLQVAALAHMGVANASKADLAIFFHESKRTGLDPFARQIHMIGRNTKNPRTDKWETKFTIQTGIDGYRLIADRADRAVPDVEAPGLAPTLRQTPTARTAPGSAVRGLPQVPGRSMAGTSRFGRAWGGTPTPPPWIAANRPWGLLERAGKPHGGAGMFRWAIWTLSSPGDVEVACSGRVRKSGVGDRAGRGQSLVRGRYRRTAQAPAAVIGIQRGTYRWAWLDERC